MDKRSWPWKRKSSSDKAAAEKAAATLDSAAAASVPAKSQSDQENYKKPTYVQISVEQYTHFTGLEEQVRSYDEQIQTMEEHMKELDEQLTSAHADITAKDTLAKQHAKVAEDAVSGWEKAEAEALALKNHLESVTLAKLTAEDRAAHLDGALMECMKQIRNLKEEHEQKLQEVVLTKTRQCEIIKHELEARIGNLDQELLRSSADNAALSRSLQERANMLIQIREEKSQAEAEIEILKSNIESCEREINSLKYELHVVTKELDIRNEEKNMSVRSAEVANKQHMEGVKKIAKLEAECQRLRGLVRKRLPGPAALAQMKLEVESLGREYGDSRLKRSPVKPLSPHLSHVPDSLPKDNDFLTERLVAMEEETKMLKEALAKRNSELLASRNMCAQITNKLQMFEGQPPLGSHERSTPKSVVRVPAEGSMSHNASNPPSLTSMSEDGNDDMRSCAGSWRAILAPELSHSKKDKSPGRPNKVDNANDLELMDDFLEMEKLAFSTADSSEAASISDGSDIKVTEVNTAKGSGSLEDQVSPSMERKALNHDGQLPLMKLQNRISLIFESKSKENEIKKMLDDIIQAVQDASNDFPEARDSGSGITELSCDREDCSKDVDLSAEVITTAKHAKPSSEAIQTVTEDSASVISLIHDFVLFLGKEAAAVHVMSPDGDALSQQIEEFSVTYHRFLCGNTGLFDFVRELSHVLTKASKLKFNILGYKGGESEINSPDCIDKVALPENRKAPEDSTMESYSSSPVNISDSTSNPEIPDYGNAVTRFDGTAELCKISSEDYEQLKSEKDGMALTLAKSTENLEMMKSKLQETEQLLAEVKLQLASAQKSNSLSETQLKCMAESYRSLEMRAHELETEVNLLRAKTGSLSHELEEEKRNHQDTLTRCKDLEEQLTRLSSLPETEDEVQTKQEKELAAAAEKLAECQETIFLLGRQLKALHPQAEPTRTSAEDEPTASFKKPQELDHQAEMDGTDLPNPDLLTSLWSVSSDADAYYTSRSPPTNTNQTKHRPSLSGSSSSSSKTTPEKQPGGFSRFFSAKGKTGY